MKNHRKRNSPKANEVAPGVYSVWPETGKRLGLGRNATYEALRRGDIPAIKIGHRWVVPIAALEKMLEGMQPNKAA